MPDRAEPGPHEPNALRGLPGGEHVLPDRIAGARVVEAELVLGVARFEPAQVVERLLGDVLLGPARSRRRARRELRDVELPENDKVVVAGEAELTPLGGEAHALVGLGAVSDQVAEAPDLLGAGRLHVSHHGLEGGQVAGDVRDERYGRRGGRSLSTVSRGWGVIARGCRWR